MSNARTLKRSITRILSISFMCFLAVSLLFLVGCSDESEEQKTHVTVSVWDESVLNSGFSDYINEQNPDIDIEWMVGQDSLDFYTYQAENGSLPDVILAKDFNEAQASTLAESLYDLSETETAGHYNEQYLSSISANGKKIVYLPAASGFEGIIVNEYLFNMYNIPVPTDRDSFLAACLAFSETDSRGFVAGLGDAETCYEVVQGFAEQSVVSEAENFFAALLQRDSSSVAVDDSAFDDAITYVNSLIDNKVISESDMSLSSDEAQQMFIDGKAAMLFISDGQASNFGDQHNMTVRAIPFFGESGSWAFVEPAFVGAVSDVQSEGVATTASNEEMHASALEVLDSIMSEEAQEKYFELTSTDLLVPTDSSTKLELPNALSTLTDCLDSGAVRTYLPTEQVAQAVGTTLQQVASGDVSVEDAGSEVGTLLSSQQQSGVEKVVVSFGEGVSNRFDDAEGNVAASDIAQTVAEQLNANFAIVSPRAARCPLYAGDKTETELAYGVAQYRLRATNLQGNQLEELLANAVKNAKSEYDLPVVSGLHIVVKKIDNSFELESVEKILATGEAAQGTGSSEGRLVTEPLDADSTYSVVISSAEGDALFNAADSYDFTWQDDTLQATWIKAFTSETLTNIPAYQDYFEFAD